MISGYVAVWVWLNLVTAMQRGISPNPRIMPGLVNNMADAAAEHILQCWLAGDGLPPMITKVAGFRR